MEYVYAAMLLHKAGKPIDEENVTKVLEAAGIQTDPTRVKALVAALSEVDIDEAIKSAPTLTAAAPAAAQQKPLLPLKRNQQKKRKKRKRRRKRKLWKDSERSSAEKLDFKKIKGQPYFSLSATVVRPVNTCMTYLLSQRLL